LESRALILNGKSTDEFSFKTHVLQNDGFNYAKKKNQLIETEYITGAIKRTINAWPPIQKSYIIFCNTPDVRDLREVKLWAKDYGTLTPSDEPDVFYEVIDVEIGNTRINEMKAFELEITFIVQPFGFEINQQTKSYSSGNTITNHTNAPMFPKVTVYGTSAVQTNVQIGSQTIYLKNLQNEVTIESKYLMQNVFNQYNAQSNSLMRGDFFEIPADTVSTITLGSGIDHIDILERWCWL
jgi:hypothetical protein